MSSIRRDELLLLHYKHLGVEYLLQRNELLETGLRAGDRANKWGKHYALERARIEANVENLCRNAVDLDDPGHVPWRDHPHPRFWRSGQSSSVTSRHTIQRHPHLRRLWLRLKKSWR